MAYLTIKQIKEQYDLSDKTIRRLYEKNKSNPDPIIKAGQRAKGYKNKKGRWVINSELLDQLFTDKRKDHTQEQPREQVKTEPKASQTNPDQNTQALLKTIEVLQSQLETKDRQIDNLTQLTDQQQKLTAQLQNQLLIASPTEPIKATEQAETPKAPTTTKKPVKKPVRKPQSKQKAPKPKNKKRWWQRG